LSLPAYSIVIDYISEGDVANLMRGYILVGGHKVRFSGVAYGRFGGQNVSPQLSASAKRKLKDIFGDLEKFQDDLQLRLVKGEFDTKAGHGMQEHHHTHME
jgi:hypothetical protein